jgi:hypothetical protein
MASAVLIVGSVISTGGLAALVMKKFGAKKGARKLVQNPNPKEETWEK